MFERKLRHTSCNNKQQLYRNDGSGRDLYISRGNGFQFQGTNLSNKYGVEGSLLKQQYQSWNFTGKPGSGYRPPSSYTIRGNQKTNYQSDGSGRDQYIQANSGGIVNQFCTNKMNPLNYFRKSLREYEQIPHKNEYYQKIDCHKTGELWRPYNVAVDEFKTSSLQRQSVNRLSVPKSQQGKRTRIKDLKESELQQIKNSNKKKRNLRSSSHYGKFSYNNYQNYDSFKQQQQSKREESLEGQSQHESLKSGQYLPQFYENTRYDKKNYPQSVQIGNTNYVV